jgi:PAS domain-containing protein
MSADFDLGEAVRTERSRAADFRIGEVAALVGLSPATIRAWERRHGIVAPGRSRFQHRRYSSEDVDTLRRIRDIVGDGVTLKAALAATRNGPAPRADRGDPPPDLSRKGAAGGAGGGAGGDASPATEARDPLPARPDSGTWGMVTDLMRELIVVVDGGGRIVESNVAVARITGTLRGRLRGMPFADLVEPFDRAKAVVACRAPFRQLAGWELNLRSVHTLYSFDCWPLRSGGRPLLAMVGRPAAA